MRGHAVGVLFLTATIGLTLLAVWNAPLPAALQAGPTPRATPTFPPPGMFGFDRGILLNLPPDASQADLGREVYRLVCSACHAYDGTGLTDKWRSGWNPADQNCWQSKCHGLNHPPDGFYLPISPPVVGGILPAYFADARQLYEYNLTRMPWHDPGMLTEEEAWAVTAHLLRMNGYDVPEVLGPENAASINLLAGDGPQRAQAIYLTAMAAPLQGPVLSAGETPPPTRPAHPVRTPAPPAAQPSPARERTWIWGLPILTAVLLLILGAARRTRKPAA